MNGRRKLNRKSIHIHRNYTAEEAARALGVHRQTVRRWIKSGQLPAIVDQKPMLVLGSDLVDFITSRNKPKHKLELNEFRCFGCQVPMAPAFDAVEFHTNSLSSDRLVALCCKCGTVMYKGFPARDLEALRAIVDVTIIEADEHLMDTPHPPSNDHLQ